MREEASLVALESLEPTGLPEVGIEALWNPVPLRVEGNARIRLFQWRLPRLRGEQKPAVEIRSQTSKLYSASLWNGVRNLVEEFAHIQDMDVALERRSISVFDLLDS